MLQYISGCLYTMTEVWRTDRNLNFMTLYIAISLYRWSKQELMIKPECIFILKIIKILIIAKY